jgi:hypothetical protein
VALPVSFREVSATASLKEADFFMFDKNIYIERIKALHKKKYGVDITDVEALILLERLTSLVRSVYQPIKTNYTKAK